MVDIVALVLSAVFCVVVLGAQEAGNAGWMAGALFVFFHVVLGVCGTRDLQLAGSARAEGTRIFRAAFVVAGVAAVAALLTADPVHRDLLFVALPAATFLVLAARWLLRLQLAIHAPAALRTVVVGAEAGFVPKSASQRGAFGKLYDVVGSMNPDSFPEDTGGVSPGVATVQGVDRILVACEELQAELVIVTGPAAADQNLVRALGWSLEGTGRGLVLASLPANVSGRRLKVVPVEGRSLVRITPPAFRGGKYFVKRAFDLLAAATALLLFSPLLLLVGLVIRAEDGHPVFFKQQRVGRDGKPFTMFKFRTMCVDAESRLESLRSLDDGNGVLFKLKDDPRVTRAGAWLRKYSIDELPQLLNVLGGSMSIVGPRPPLPSEVAGYTGHTNRRMLVTPGLTGLWQVSGRSNLEWEESVGLDLYYVENWSIAFDLEIIQRTIRVVLRPVGAY